MRISEEAMQQARLKYIALVPPEEMFDNPVEGAKKLRTALANEMERLTREDPGFAQLVADAYAVNKGTSPMIWFVPVLMLYWAVQFQGQMLLGENRTVLPFAGRMQ